VNPTENRQHQRVFFDEDAGVIAYFERNKGDGSPFPAHVMNMSAGGLGVSTREHISGSVKQGDTLHLNFIKKHDATSSVRGIQARIQWVLEEPTNDKLVLGLEFRGVDALMLGVIQKFIETTAG